MVEVGVRILKLELLDSPPGGGCVGDVVASAVRQGRVEDANHPALAVEDEGAGVALGREGPGLLVVIVDGELDGLDTEIIANVGFEAGATSNREVAGGAVFHDDDAGLTVAVVSVGTGQVLAPNAAINPKLAIGGELEHSPRVTIRVELVDEFV